MSEIYEVRRINLRVLVEKNGCSEVAKQAGYSGPSYLSQMVGPKPTKEVTEKTARKIEQALLLPMYWLDQGHDTNGANPAMYEESALQVDFPAVQTVNSKKQIVELEHLSACAYILCAAMAKCGVLLPKKKFAVAIAMLLDDVGQSDEAKQKLAEQLIQLSM